MTTWADAKTLREVAIQLMVDKKTDSLEFKALLSIFGREKLARFWREYQAEKKKEAEQANGIPHGTIG